jgi:hypothetical protein
MPWTAPEVARWDAGPLADDEREILEERHQGVASPGVGALGVRPHDRGVRPGITDTLTCYASVSTGSPACDGPVIRILAVSR